METVTLLVDKWVLVPVQQQREWLGVTVDKEAGLMVQRGGMICVLLKGKAKSAAMVHVTSEKKVVLDRPVSKLELGLPLQSGGGCDGEREEVNEGASRRWAGRGKGC